MRTDNRLGMLKLAESFLERNTLPPARPDLSQCGSEGEARFVALGGQLDLYRRMAGDDFDDAFAAYEEHLRKTQRLSAVQYEARLTARLARLSAGEPAEEPRRLSIGNDTNASRGRLRVMRAMQALRAAGRENPSADISSCQPGDEADYVQAGGTRTDFAVLTGEDQNRADRLLAQILKDHGMLARDINRLSSDANLMSLGLNPDLVNAATESEARRALGLKPEIGGIESDLARALAKCRTESEAMAVFKAHAKK